MMVPCLMKKCIDWPMNRDEALGNSTFSEELI